MNLYRFYQLLAALICFLFINGSHATEQNKLVILTWADYMDPAIIAEFEQEYGTSVSMVYFQTDEHRSQILLNNNASGYDLILSSGIDLASYIRRGWLDPINHRLVPNHNHIYPRWQTAFEGADSYGIPYFWGTLGIIYRSDLVTPTRASWRFLYEPENILKGHIGMIANSRDIISMALKSLGYSANAGEKQMLKEVEQLLLAQKPFVRSYQYMNLDENSEMLTGELRASMAYSGDALMVMEHSDKLAFFIPEEGTNLWVDYFTIGSRSSRPDLAHKFLDFINRPVIACRQAEYTLNGTPNASAQELLPGKVINNPIIYPDAEVLAKSEFYKPLTPKQIIRRKKVSSGILRDYYEAEY